MKKIFKELTPPISFGIAFGLWTIAAMWNWIGFVWQVPLWTGVVFCAYTFFRMFYKGK